jgi:beta-keto acid cleavage enzyme
MKLEYYREVVERIRGSDTDLIINLTSGTVLTTPEIRTAHIVELRPEICTLDLNTQWFGGGAVINSPRSIKAMAERMYAAGSKPELEIFNTGDIMLAHDLVADGTLKMPALFLTGIKYGLASTPEVMCLVKSSRCCRSRASGRASVPDGIPSPCWRRLSSLVVTAASAWRTRCTSPGANRHPATPRSSRSPCASLRTSAARSPR